MKQLRAVRLVAFLFIGVSGLAFGNSDSFLDRFQDGITRMLLDCRQNFLRNDYNVVENSRIIYGLAHAGREEVVAMNAAFVDSYYVAGASPHFINNLKTYDRKNGSFISPHELAYAAAGQLALYQTLGDRAALKRANRVWLTIRSQFKNAAGGLVNGWNPVTYKKTNTVDFGSTVYVAMASGFDLIPTLTDQELKDHQQFLIGIANVVARHMWQSDGLMVETLDQDLKPRINRSWFPKYKGVDGIEREGNFDIGGHQAQALWFLVRSLGLPLSTSDRTFITSVIRSGFDFLLQDRFVDLRRGGIYNVFVRETGEIYQEPWAKNKALWQQTELVLAIAAARRMGVYDTERSQSVIATTVGFLTSYFDSSGKPIAAVVTPTGDFTGDDLPNLAHITAYHWTELARFLKWYIQSDNLTGEVIPPDQISARKI